MTEIERDYRNTLTVCSRVTDETLASTGKLEKWQGFGLKFLAPLL